jgi:hypothetical protein
MDAISHGVAPLGAYFNLEAVTFKYQGECAFPIGQTSIILVILAFAVIANAAKLIPGKLCLP